MGWVGETLSGVFLAALDVFTKRTAE